MAADVSPQLSALGIPPVGRLGVRKRATAMALRRAALQLAAENGYEATSTDDIARAAGVSPRTFFNYFPTKEAVFQMPEGLVQLLAVSLLEARPAGEDPVASFAAVARGVCETLRSLAGQQDSVFVGGARLVFADQHLYGLLLQRRDRLEEAVWEAAQRRGTSPHDLATRVALSTTVTIAFLAVRRWMESNGEESLSILLTRCLALTPDPARVLAGLVDPSRESDPVI